jgi:transcriptional regulator with XRE-family HTH domain
MARKINIKALRKRLRVTQQQLADRLGVDQATVSRLETGRPPSGPVQKLLEQLAQST